MCTSVFEKKAYFGRFFPPVLQYDSENNRRHGNGKQTNARTYTYDSSSFITN